jgi:hypothetical protein
MAGRVSVASPSDVPDAAEAPTSSTAPRAISLDAITSPRRGAAISPRAPRISPFFAAI